MDKPTQSRPTLAQVGLGLFILWQIIFMISANLLGMIPHGRPEEDELSDYRVTAIETADRGHAQRAVDALAEVTDCWGQGTGQMQAWWLFAPTFPLQATFPLVELSWDDGQTPPVRLATFDEPENPYAYFRPLGSGDRLFHYEVRLGLLFTTWSPESFAKLGPQWRDGIAQRIRRQWKSMQAYIRWRTNQFEHEHPELPPPSQAILRLRVFRSPSVDEKPPTWAPPAEVCVARWRIGVTPAPGMLPLEMCDPVTGQFVPVSQNGSAPDE